MPGAGARTPRANTLGNHEHVTPEEARLVAEAMKCYGGPFVRALGEALLLADGFNRAKIKATWPDYWEKYASFAETQTLSEITQRNG